MVNYEQKYKGLVQKLKNAKEIKGGYTFKSVLDEVAPELQESNNEIVRKEIINYLEINSNQMTPKQFSDFRERWLPWLEKQHEQKADDDVIEEMVSKYRNNPIKDNERFGKPVNCMVDAYRQGLTDAISTFKLENKPSDWKKSTAWSEEDETKLKSACALIRNTSLNGNEGLVDSTIDWLNSLKDRVQPKQEWSEEDAKCIDELIKFFDSMKNCLAVEERHQENRRWLKFLKSLKGTNIIQLLQEWSIEDNIRLQEAIRIVQNYHNNIKDEHLFASSGWCLGWLKSLKERYTWIINGQ